MPSYGLSASVQRTWEVDKGYILTFDYDLSGNLIYYGTARAGSTKSDPVWKIRKLVYDGTNPVDILWANGHELFEHAWDARASLSYS